MAYILVAQHNPVTAAYLTTTLKKAGHTVQTIDNALDLWRASAQGLFDVLLLDTRLPGIDSFVLAQKALRDIPDLQIIFTNGFSGAILDTLATPAYAPAPITSRPFHMKSIVAYVRYLMGGAFPESARQRTENNVVYADFQGAGRALATV